MQRRSVTNTETCVPTANQRAPRARATLYQPATEHSAESTGKYGWTNHRHRGNSQLLQARCQFTNRSQPRKQRGEEILPWRRLRQGRSSWSWRLVAAAAAGCVAHAVAAATSPWHIIVGPCSRAGDTAGGLMTGYRGQAALRPARQKSCDHQDDAREPELKQRPDHQRQTHQS